MKPFPNRWWYCKPWKVSRPFLPMAKVYRCGDEYCNDTLYLRFPLLGSVVIRIGRTVRLNGRCERCVEEFGPWCEGCENCHRGPRCHYWVRCINEDTGHEKTLQRCPACGGSYCQECEQHPEENCP